MIAEIKLRARFLQLKIGLVEKCHFYFSHLVRSNYKQKKLNLKNLGEFKKTTNFRNTFSPFPEIAKLNLFIRFKIELLE